MGDMASSRSVGITAPLRVLNGEECLLTLASEAISEAEQDGLE